jgi:hypothetical protein
MRSTTRVERSVQPLLVNREVVDEVSELKDNVVGLRPPTSIQG